MVTRMATRMLPHLLLLLLAWQCASLHARFMPREYGIQRDTTHGYVHHGPYHDAFARGEYIDAQDVAIHAGLGEFPHDRPVLFDTEWDSQSDMSTFARETETLDFPANEIETNRWDESATFAIQDNMPSPIDTEYYDAFEDSTDGELPDDIFIDSPEIPQDFLSDASFADDIVYDPDVPSRRHSQDAYENDEVFFNTSAADTIYKAKDDDLSFSAFGMNASTAEDMLSSLAKAMGGCGTGNPIDDCWSCDPNWRSHRQALAACAIGFGRNAIGGKNGPIYVITSNEDDAENPRPGTLRHGLSRDGPQWIIFAKSMTIALEGELWVTAFKTIDGRGADVHIVGAQITIQNTNNVIVHGVHIHDIKVTGPTTIRVSPSQVVLRVESDGDGLHILNSKNVWVDHCYLAKAADGLLDATRASTMITVSNCLFENHNKVMLFGSNPTYILDMNMKVTVAFNKFGRGLIQRLPRCRYGVFHILNNDYSEGWDKYAIGGSQNPTILSQGNYFKPGEMKEVTKRIDDNGPTFGGWDKWNWASSGDIFLNGAYFTGSGAEATSASVYAKAFSTSSRPGHLVPAFTRSAGPLRSSTE